MMKIDALSQERNTVVVGTATVVVGSRTAPEKELSFIWWNRNFTEEDVQAALASPNRYRRITYMSYILNDAEFEEIWKFLTLKDIQENFWYIRWRTAEVRAMWSQILTLLGYAPGERIDPRATRVLV